MLRPVSMTVDANGGNKLPGEVKGIEDGVVDERPSASQVPDMTINATNGEGAVSGAASGSQGPGILQQQPLGMVVHWERFLHVRSIRVLLVENDDSTRHVVTALLKNCNYEVLEAANGLQAWKILEDLANHIDLVLTEVVMPFLSGVALLCKIMSHNTRKNIPVIMMSSHDSMGLVFQCLSKGAVDFLVKPIRKNELKNLWQHIWRRCHSSSGSGSESGTHTQKSVKSKSTQKSDSSESDDEEVDRSDDLNDDDGSDNGSGAQSSWTKQVAEVGSSQALSPIEITKCPDSTCGQVIRDASGNKSVDIMVAREDNLAERKELETIVPIDIQSSSVKLMETPIKQVGIKRKSLSENTDCGIIIRQIDNGQLNSAGDHLFGKHKGGSNEISSTLMDLKLSGSTRDVTSILDKNALNETKEPNLSFQSKRNKYFEDSGKSVQDVHCVFQCSEQSAFSRYNTSSIVFKAPNQVTGSNSVICCGAEVAERISVVDIQDHLTDHIERQHSNGNDVNTENGASILKDKFETRSTLSGLHPSSFSPVNDLRCSKQLIPLNEMKSAELDLARNSQENCQIQLDNHRRKHLYDLEQQSSSYQNELITKKPLIYGSSNATGGTMGINQRNICSASKSASGSNHGSNGTNVSNNIMNIVDTNAECDVCPSRISESGDDSGIGTRLEENRIAQRTAALNKFRQKRKERCFTKKVRYHNRQKLAEQRPRVRGQFVKQIGVDSSNKRSDE